MTSTTTLENRSSCNIYNLLDRENPAMFQPCSLFATAKKQQIHKTKDQTGPFFRRVWSPGSPRSSDQGAVGQVAQEQGILWQRPGLHIHCLE